MPTTSSLMSCTQEVSGSMIGSGHSRSSFKTVTSATGQLRASCISKPPGQLADRALGTAPTAMLSSSGTRRLHPLRRSRRRSPAEAVRAALMYSRLQLQNMHPGFVWLCAFSPPRAPHKRLTGTRASAVNCGTAVQHEHVYNRSLIVIPGRSFLYANSHTT